MNKLNHIIMTLLACGAGVMVIFDVNNIVRFLYAIFFVSLAVYFLYKKKY